jgi:hypothetical protein
MEKKDVKKTNQPEKQEQSKVQETFEFGTVSFSSKDDAQLELDVETKAEF